MYSFKKSAWTNAADEDIPQTSIQQVSENLSNIFHKKFENQDECCFHKNNAKTEDS